MDGAQLSDLAGLGACGCEQAEAGGAAAFPSHLDVNLNVDKQTKLILLGLGAVTLFRALVKK